MLSVFTFSTLTVEVYPSKTTYGANDEIIYKFVVQANAGTTVTNAVIKFPVPAETTTSQCVIDPRMGACSLTQSTDPGGQTDINYLTVPIVGTITSGQYIEVSVITKLNTSGNYDIYNQTGVPFSTYATLTTKELPAVTSANVVITPSVVVDTQLSTVSKRSIDHNRWQYDEWNSAIKVPGETYYYELTIDPQEVNMGTFLKNIVMTDVLSPELEFVTSSGYGALPPTYPNSSYDPSTRTVTCNLGEKKTNSVTHTCTITVKVKESTPVGVKIDNKYSVTYEHGDTGRTSTYTSSTSSITTSGDAITNLSKGYNKSSSTPNTYAVGEAITYNIKGDFDKNNTSAVIITDNIGNTFMQTNKVYFGIEKTSNYSSSDLMEIRLYKNGATIPYKTYNITPSTTIRRFEVTYDLSSDFPSGSSDQITKVEFYAPSLPKDDYQYAMNLSGVVLSTDRNGISAVDGEKLKNDVTIENNGKTKTATTSPIVKLLFNKVSRLNYANQDSYVGELASKVTSYNGVATTFNIVLAKDADVTLTSSILPSVPGKPFNQIVKSINGGIPAEYANKQYEVKLYKNGSTTPYNTLTGTTVASGVNQVWFDESATFTGTKDLLTKYEITIKDVKAYSTTQQDARVLGMHEFMNVLYEGLNGEIPVSGNYVSGSPPSEHIVGDVIKENHKITLSTLETVNEDRIINLQKANENRVVQAATGAYNSGVDIPFTISLQGYNSDNYWASDDGDQLPANVDPNSPYYRKENAVLGVLLPLEFEYSKFNNMTTSKCAYNQPQIINNYNGTGRQLVRFTQVDPTCSNNTDILSSAAISNTAQNSATVSKNFNFYIKAKAGTPEGTYTFQGVDVFTSSDVKNPLHNTSRWASGGIVKGIIDANDLDGDGLVNDKLRTADSVAIRILDTGRLNVTKYVRREGDTAWKDAGQVAYMDVADTKVEYKIVIENVGNLPLKDIRLIDVLPYVGDTYITDTTKPRDSSWTPTLLAPINISNNTSGITPNIYYNVSSTPNLAVLNASNPITSDWTNNYSTARSFLIELPSANLEPAKSIELQFEGLKDESVVLNVNDRAWNSTASLFKIINKDGSIATPSSPLEPEKVGIVSVLSTHIGHYVWNDLDKDGIQDSNEIGINGVKIEVINNSTGNVEYTTLTTNDPSTGNPGYYDIEALFMTSINYKLKYTFPDAEYIISPSNQGADDLKDSDIMVGVGTYIGTITKQFTMGTHDRTLDVGAYLPIDRKITKTVVGSIPNTPEIADQGEILTYTISVKNEKSTPSSSIIVKDNIASLAISDYEKYGIESITVTQNPSVAYTGDLKTSSGLVITSLPANTTETIIYKVKMLQGFSSKVTENHIKNVATVDGTLPNNCPIGTNLCASTDTVISDTVDVSKTLTAESITKNNIVELGEELTYTITLDNTNGTSDIYNTPIKDSLLSNLPNGVTILSAPVASTGTLTGSNGNYVLDKVSKGTLTKVTYILKVVQTQIFGALFI